MCLEACSQLRFNNVFIVIYLLLDCDKKKSEKILFYTLIFSEFKLHSINKKEINVGKFKSLNGF
jgi:hypothetical protein